MRRAVVASILLFASLSSRVGRADDAPACSRPTDAAGYAGFTYATSAVASFDSARVRVFYTRTGPHAVRAATTRTDAVPDDVARVSEVTEDALARYSAMGYRAPIADDRDLACGSNGGDGRLDVYLVAFDGGDGTTATERCVQAGGEGTRCASFILAEADFEGHYATADEGIRTVLPHEVFHAVQNAYDAELDRFWAEGTAQWATKTLYPDLVDFERNLPAFFHETDRSLDAPPAGVTAGFLYGAAIWPLFLSAQHGASVVRATLEQESATGALALAATDTALANVGSSLPAALTQFSLWNVATGPRAGDAGYANRATYPQVPLSDFPARGTLTEITSGAMSLYYRLHADTAEALSFEADPSRLSASLVPLADGRADLAHAAALPTTLTGDAILVVTGLSTNKADAPFTVTRAPVPLADGGAPDGAAPDGSTPASGDLGNDVITGCSIASAPVPMRATTGSSLAFALPATALALARRRSRPRESSVPRRSSPEAADDHAHS